AGDPLVVIVTETHRDAISGRLRARGFDVDGVCAGKQMIILDAEETLARFMVGAHPDAALFSAALGELLDGAVPTVGRPQRLRAYGEMVDVLWRNGNHVGAIALEDLWNGLQQT